MEISITLSDIFEFRVCTDTAETLSYKYIVLSQITRILIYACKQYYGQCTTFTTLLNICKSKPADLKLNY